MFKQLQFSLVNTNVPNNLCCLIHEWQAIGVYYKYHIYHNVDLQFYYIHVASLREEISTERKYNSPNVDTLDAALVLANEHNHFLLNIHNAIVQDWLV